MDTAVERALLAGTAVIWFLPVLSMIWTGNAVAPLALAVGGLLASRSGGSSKAPGLAVGASLALAALLKLTPFALLPGVLRRGGHLAVGTLATLGVVVLASVLLAPRAWADYVVVLSNIIAGDVGYGNNLAPAVSVANLGAPAVAGDIVRAATLAVAVVLVGASAVLARRADAWPAAVGSGVLAGLLVPAVLWYQYLVVLLPLAAFAWVRAGRRLRAALVASGALVSVGLALPPLSALGGLCLGVTTMVALWPRMQPHVVGANPRSAQVVA